jgi:hypothetical protein
MAPGKPMAGPAAWLIYAGGRIVLRVNALPISDMNPITTPLTLGSPFANVLAEPTRIISATIADNSGAHPFVPSHEFRNSMP